ncbi:MAG: hypothetical protein IPH88_18610 [Bacteroidales bacterium]|nr:hypothetical protein [Bacteroidales bacterium]
MGVNILNASPDSPQFRFEATAPDPDLTRISFSFTLHLHPTLAISHGGFRIHATRTIQNAVSPLANSPAAMARCVMLCSKEGLQIEAARRWRKLYYH